MPNIITKLEIQKKNKERVNVFLDEKFAFGLNLNAALGLKKGQVLSPAEIEQLRQGDEQQVAYERALFFLGFRPRSRVEVEQYLREKEYDATVVEAVVQKLLAEKHLDDEAFAQFWLESREQFRPRSTRALRYELRQKGIDREVIDEAVATVDEDAAAWAVIESKLARWQSLEQPDFTQKVLSLLARRGFAYDIARRISKRAWAQVSGVDNGEDLLEAED
jgi:regulatory protein